jgi:hypothetical protein
MDVDTTSDSGFWAEYPRDVVRVHGPDAQTYLHSQLSQDLRDLRVGDSRWAFLLQPTGKIDVLLRVWRTGDDEYVLDTDAGFGDAMTARLTRFKIRVKAELEVLRWRCIAVRGAELPAGVASWGGGADLLGPEVVPPDGVREGSTDDLLAARVDAAWPAMGAEIVPGDSIVAETGIADTAVSFTKGCYPGQELVERMDSRGAAAPRVLRKVDAPEGANVGDAVLRDGVEVGVYTSVSGTSALAKVKRTVAD